MKYTFAGIALTVFLTGCNNGNGSRISASGTIEATDVTVSAQVGGLIRHISVDEGSAVRLGDTLMIIDEIDWYYQYTQAQAAFETADAQYRLALKGAREEDILQAEANYKNAESDVRRMEELYRGKSITEKQMDDARMRFIVNQQLWEKMKRGSRPEEIDAARARRDQAKALAASLQKKVHDCIVVAPLSGIVTKRFAERGELATVGMALYRISDLSLMDITIFVSESDLPRVQLNQKAMVNVDAFSKKDFQGKVVFISSTAEFTPKNIQTKDERTKLVFAVKVKVPNPDGILKAGIPADVNLVLGGQ